MSFLGQYRSIPRRIGISFFSLFSLILFIYFPVNGQEEGFIVRGAIVDQNSGAPIENVNITLRGTSTGTISNALGTFKLRVKTLPFFIEYSHVSYEILSQKFEHKPLSDIHASLSPKSESLSEITITSQQIDTLFADKIYSVLDYELCDEVILLLIYRSRLSQSELLLKDYHGNERSR